MIFPNNALLRRGKVFYLPSVQRTAYFSVETQRKIKKALSRFWQERFISLKNPDSPTAGDFLLKTPFFLNSEHFVEDTSFPKTNPALLDEALNLAGFSKNIMQQELITLSNGELRRLMLARNFMEEPDLWILNDPFGGLDPEYRKFLSERIEKFRAKGIKMEISGGRENEDFSKVFEGGGLPLAATNPAHCKGEACAATPSEQGEIILSLNNVSVNFGSKIVLNSLSWEIRKGEHWAITGPNGSGKSTLLGILSGDHPQIYRNDITLLGQTVKNGFSIEEHKKKIGFFSPEMALQTPRRITAHDILIEHFPQPPLAEEKKQTVDLLNSLGLKEHIHNFLNELSEENLRLVLIVRAMLRKPQLLILDEPTQGMSAPARKKLFAALDKNCENNYLNDTTLIFVTHYPDEFPKRITNVLKMRAPV